MEEAQQEPGPTRIHTALGFPNALTHQKTRSKSQEEVQDRAGKGKGQFTHVAQSTNRQGSEGQAGTVTWWALLGRVWAEQLVSFVVLELVLELVPDTGGAADPNLSASPAQLEPSVPAPLTDWNHLC